MPIYGYRCTACNHELEVWQSMSDEPLTACPECQGRLQKMLYPVGVQFKGSGFYTTDYKNGSKTNGGSRGSKDSGEASKSDGKSETKSESKPETTTTSSASGADSKAS